MRSRWTRPTWRPPPNWGMDYRFLGQFDKSLEYLDRAILASPSDPSLVYWYDSKAWANFGLKRYD